MASTTDRVLMASTTEGSSMAARRGMAWSGSCERTNRRLSAPVRPWRPAFAGGFLVRSLFERVDQTCDRSFGSVDRRVGLVRVVVRHSERVQQIVALRFAHSQNDCPFGCYVHSVHLRSFVARVFCCQVPGLTPNPIQFAIRSLGVHGRTTRQKVLAHFGGLLRRENPRRVLGVRRTSVLRPEVRTNQLAANPQLCCESFGANGLCCFRHTHLDAGSRERLARSHNAYNSRSLVRACRSFACSLSAATTLSPLTTSTIPPHPPRTRRNRVAV